MKQDPEQEDRAPFDDCRTALSFALNAHLVTAPTAFMNKAMAEVRVELKKSKKKRGQTESELLGEILGPDAMTAEQLLELETAARQKRGGSLVRPLALRWRNGLEKHHQAGLILHHFGRLDQEHQLVLAGLLTTPGSPCACRSMCCSGWRVNERWNKALIDMCEVIKLKAEGIAEPGKKGLSSQPLMRRLVVEHFFTKKDLSVADLARVSKVSYVTAGKHRGWILEYLERLESKAWEELAPIFDAAGITGDHL